MGEIISMITMRPVTFFILLTIGVLLVPSIVIPYWYLMMIKIEHNVAIEANYAHLQLLSTIEDTANLVPSNSSAAHLATILASQLPQDPYILFSQIQTKVAQALFEALMITPHVTQASYIGLDGLLFSYFIDGDRTYAIYSNSSFPSNYSNASASYTWYIQQASSKTGALYGEANVTKPFTVTNETWFQKAMGNPNGYASLGFKWISCKEEQEPNLFLDTVRLGAVGAISLGFAVKRIINAFFRINLKGGSLFIATQFGDHSYSVLLEGIKEANIKVNNTDKALVQGRNNKTMVGEVTCKPNKGRTNSDGGITLDIGATNLIFYCSSIDIAMVPSVYILAFPSKGLLSNVEKHTKVALMLLILMMVAMAISIFAFVALIVRAARREVHLCAAYMREMDKTAQAERKSMKQSLAFASANHDVRGYLACIKGLIDLSYNDVHPSSVLASNLNKMQGCAEDLLALVNSILDFSKIEAGKMQLEQTEFNLAQLLEDIADLHHPIAMRKGLEVILDPCDGSVIKFSHVKGDRAKLKQILTNLLGNAVKFTSEGHISIHAWAKKPSLEDSIIASNKNNILNRMSSFFSKNKQAYNELEEFKTIKQDPTCMEFEFEVEDTGPGIPKDQRESIFENFVQVKENSAGQVGTGLGLGIVQSLVRLMGGDIKAVDKANGVKGTCFKFNIFLTIQENSPVGQGELEHDATRVSPGLITCTRKPRVEGSLVVLLIKNDERRRMVQRYMEGLGIKLVVLRHVNQLPRALKRKIKPKLSVSRWYSSSSSGSLSGAYLSSCSDPCRGGGSKLLPLSVMDGDDDDILPIYKRASFRGSVKCLMLVVDANAGDFQELCRFVAEFRRDLYITCVKVVWLVRHETRGAPFPGLQAQNLPSTDCILSEPLHGSRLFQVIGLLPEFGGDLTRMSPLRMSNPQSETEQLGSSSSSEQLSSSKTATYTDFINDNDKESKRKADPVPDLEGSCSEKTSTWKQEVSSNRKPLYGKRFLIAEDDRMLRKLAATFVTRWGASADVCVNGREALEIICKALSELPAGEATKFPYDCILMDCQMPIMNGYEAVKRIRQEEKKYSIHIPIIALTAHEAGGEEGKEIVEAGMDFHLTKPLKRDQLLEAMSFIYATST